MNMNVEERTRVHICAAATAAPSIVWIVISFVLLGVVYGIPFLRKYTTQTHMSYGLQWLEKDSTEEKKLISSNYEKKTHQQTRERYGVERNDTKHFIDCRLWINTNHFIAVHPFELDWCDYAMFVLWKWCVQHTESNRFESKCCTESKASTSRRWSIRRDIERERNKRKKNNTYKHVWGVHASYDCNRCKTIWQMIFNGVHHLYRKIMSA